MPVGHDSQAIVECYLQRVWKAEDGLLRLVTTCTSVEKIRVFALTVWIDAHGNKMVHMECPSTPVPLFSMKAVHAPENEFVAQPITIAPVTGITHGTLSPIFQRRCIL